ncbi:MAG: hypothetical protein AABY15_01935 [Nanoarchaeota archaeon]
MKLLLEKIIKDCLEAGIKVQTELMPDGELGYKVDGFSKSGEAFLYVEGEAVVCKTRYDRIDHVLTFRDLAYIALEWYENYKNREPFENPDPRWESVFIKLGMMSSNGEEKVEDDDLPF